MASRAMCSSPVPTPGTLRNTSSATAPYRLQHPPKACQRSLSHRLEQSLGSQSLTERHRKVQKDGQEDQDLSESSEGSPELCYLSLMLLAFFSIFLLGSLSIHQTLWNPNIYTPSRQIPCNQASHAAGQPFCKARSDPSLISSSDLFAHRRWDS